MAGHSKWANIKRQKARVDAQKGKVFARLSRAIIIAARHGGPDPAANFQLRSAIDKAKAAGIPNDNIDRAIAKGSGTLSADGQDLEEIRYEGYGPSGVAVLMEALTDNRNRTAADIRAAFNKHGGNLGETGCVGWMFEPWGVVTVTAPEDDEAFLATLLEAEAETYEIIDTDNGAIAEVRCDVAALEALSEALGAQGYAVQDTESRWIPLNTVEIMDIESGRRLLKLMDALEELDDLETVAANFALSDAVVAALDI